MNIKCKYCDYEDVNPYRVDNHRKQAHPETLRPYKPKSQTLVLSPFDRLLDLKKQAKDIVQELEQERDRLHQRIVQIDDVINKYNKGQSIL